MKITKWLETDDDGESQLVELKCEHCKNKDEEMINVITPLEEVSEMVCGECGHTSKGD